MDNITVTGSGSRRAFFKTAAAAGLTANIFTGSVLGANDRIAVGFIGLGNMGSGNLGYAMKVPEAQPAALCDVYQPHLERAEAQARKGGYQIKGVSDFRQILADKSIDAVCISTPDHWHAYMTVEACKAGKDVFVEKPACVYVEEGPKMIEAARKYDRVVQAGTMQRSGGYFQKAKAIVASGVLGDVTFCHAWQAGSTEKEQWGNPPDSDPPAGLDWDLWLGPARRVPFNANRWGIDPKRWSTFRYFWDYAGGAMTDWGVHLIDPLHQCFGEIMPGSISSLGAKFYVEDNVETPDTLLSTFQYRKFLASYESRTCNSTPMFGQGYGSSIHGTDATLVLNRGGCWVTPTKDSKVEPVSYEKNTEMAAMNVPHWKNFLACIRSRQRPTSDIETCVRSSTACILANLSLRFKTRLDWDEANWTVTQEEIRPHLKYHYRAPWKLEV
jgi:predicted dehydrogenase